MLLLMIACSDQEFIGQKDGGLGDDTAEAAPDVTLAPDAVDFGALLPGESATALVTIGNVGTADLFVNDLVFADAEPELSLTALPKPQIAVGASVELVLTWTAASGPLDATLLLRTDDPDEPELSLPIVGDMPPGDLVVEPTFYDFGTLEVGASTETAITVRNAGEGPLTVSSLDYASNDGDLRVVDPGALAALPHVLGPGESTEVRVEYAPSAPGSDEGTLLVTADDPDTPQTGATQAGMAEDDPCDGFTQTVTVVLTVDDAWKGWIDGTEFTAPGQNSWTDIDTVEWEMECGDHTLALYATDTAAVISGVLAAVLVEGSVRFLSGPSNWSMLDVAPTGDWTAVGYDDSAWHTPEVCGDTSPWGTYWPEPLYALGAQWIWWTTQCRDLGEAWLRLDFTVP
jgi:hypothetical protein